MATAGKGQNKSAFLRDLFRKNPAIKEAEATEAWQEAGNEGAIGSSLFSNVKTALKKQAGGGATATAAAPVKPKAKSAANGPKGKRASQPVDEAISKSDGETAPNAAVSKSGDRERLLDRVEDGIDDLIGELKGLGGLEEALEALRRARRVVVRSHEG